MLRRKRKTLPIGEEEDESPNKMERPVAPTPRRRTGSPVKKHHRIDNSFQQEESIFCQLVSEAGMKLKNSFPHQLDVDQAIFQRDLKNLLKKHPRFPVVIDDFVESMKAYFSDTSKLESLLMPTEVSPLCKSSRGGEQDSPLRLLLGIDILQVALFPSLLEKVAEFSIMQENGSSSEADIPILILSQMRWLGVLVDSKGLSNKMLEILPVLPLDLQKKMIILFPEILHDSEHSEVAKKLSEMMLDNKNLIMVIADTLSTLNVQAEDIVEVKLSVLDLLQTVPVEEVPTLINFLLNNIPSDQAFQVISELRVKLDLITSLIPLSTSTPANREVSCTSLGKSSAIPIMEASLSACRWQKSVCETWIKVIEKIPTSKDHLPMDLVMVILLYSIEARRKALEGLTRNKIRSGHFSLVLLGNTIKIHSKVIKDHFPSALRLANILLKSYELSLSKFGSAIYKDLFVALDKYCQQEIIGQLMTHVGSRVPSEIDAALAVLSSLVDTNKLEVAPFATFLKSLLDYLDFLSLDQTRVVYMLLSELAYKAGPEGAMVQDELRIVIRKQVTHSNLKYMRMGVVGTLMAAKAMCVSRNQNSMHSRFSFLSANSTCRRSDVGECSSRRSGSTSSLEKTFSQETIQLLDLVKKSCSAYAETTVLFYDELSRLIQKGWLDDKVEVWINDIMLSSFQENFIIDVDTDTELSSVNGLELVLRQSNPGPLTSEVALNLAFCIESGDLGTQPVQQKNCDITKSALIMPAQFRLLRICEHIQNAGVLDSIDVLSLCPVVMPKWDSDANVFGKQPLESKRFVCLSIVHCINWLREVINAFVGQTDKEIKTVVVQHLQQLVKLQGNLLTLLPETPGFTFPLAMFDQADLQKPAVKPKPKAAPEKKTNKGKKTDADESRAETQRTQKNKESPKAHETKSADPKNILTDLSAYRASFRELDLEVFLLLQNGLDLSSDEDEDSSPVTEKFSLKLGPSELLFLLEDLFLKVEHVLLSSSPKRFSPLKPRGSKQVGFGNLSLYTAPEVVKALVEILPSVRTLVEDCSVHFQSILTRNDGVLDGPGMDSEKSMTLSSCMALLFKIFNTLISWCGFQEEEFTDLFNNAVAVLSSHASSSQNSQTTLKERLRYLFEYLEKYKESLTSLECGVALVRLLETLASHPQADPQLLRTTSKLAKNLLTTAWPNSASMKGPKHSDHVQILLGIYINNGQNTMECLEDICTAGIPEIIQNEDKEASSQSYPTLTKHTFGIYHRVILHQLVEVVKNIDSEEDSEVISQWSTSVNMFNMVISVVKIFAARSNLTSCLKFGRQFVECFIKQCMPLLDKQFSQKAESSTQLIRSLQASTRYLQHICGHAKEKKDVSLTKHVPTVKKTLEAFVFRVKLMLTHNNCKEAFWMGNLKNRDIRGEEILSQVPNDSDDDDNDDGYRSENDKSDEEQNADEAKSDQENEGENGDEIASNNEEENSEEY